MPRRRDARIECRSQGDQHSLTAPKVVEHFFRHEYGRLVAMLSRRVGVRDLAEVGDAVQSALLTALETWTRAGLPDNPPAWLHRVAHNNLMAELRRRPGRRRIPEQDVEETAVALENDPENFLPGEMRDDFLRMLFVCCDEAIPVESQLALALKTLCGFDIREIALRLFASDANVYKRLGRARRRLREVSPRLGDLTDGQYSSRLPAVHRILYLLFTEGDLSSRAETAIRRELCEEAIRLATVLAEDPAGQTPATFALLSLMHLHTARMTARQDSSGGLLLLEEQDRNLRDRRRIQTRLEWLTKSSRGDRFSPVSCGGGDRGRTLPRSLVSGNALGQSGGMLRAAHVEPGGRGPGVARPRGRARGPQRRRAAGLVIRLLALGRGAGRPASALRKRRRGESLSRHRLQVGSHPGGEGSSAASAKYRPSEHFFPEPGF